MPLARLLTGHGDAGHRARAARRRAPGRPRPPLRAHRRGPRATARARAFEIAAQPVARADGRRAAAARRLGGARAPRAAAGRRRASSERVDRRRPADRTASRPFALAAPTPTPPSPTRRWPPARASRHPARGQLDDARDRFDLSGRVARRHRRHARARARDRARRSRQAGADVVVVSRKADACDEVAAELRAEGGRALRRTPATSGTGTSSTRLVEDVYREFGRVDVLVNNAGVSPLYDDAQRRHRGAVRQGDRRQPQGPVPARRARRRADGRPATAARSSTSRARAPCARPATSSPTRPPRPASTP